MRTINKLKLLEHGVGQSDFIKKKAQTTILGGKIIIGCRCGRYGNFITECFVCPYGDIESCLVWAHQQCGNEYGATCSGEGLEGC